MPILSISTVPANIGDIFKDFDDAVTEGRLVRSSETGFAFRLGDAVVEATGTELDYFNNLPFFGTITDMVVRERGTAAPLAEMTGLDIGAVLIAAAVDAEQNSGSPDALETLILSRGWTYEGFSGRDILGSGARTDSGVRVDFTGDDTFDLLGGKDRLNAGGGNDSVSGGAGADLLIGGAGNDEVSGGAGNDTVRGGRGKDELTGNRGNDDLRGEGARDFLDGGAGRDRIDGGAGRDNLTGGGARDVFIFDAGDGRDRVTDFQDGVDVIRLRASDPEIEAAGGGTRITYDGGVIILAGVDASLIDGDDFV